MKSLRPIDIKRQKLIVDYMPLANKQAKVFCAKHQLEHMEDDYTSIAYIGLCKAAKRFRACRGTSFSHFASIYIIGAMIDEYRQSNNLEYLCYTDKIIDNGSGDEDICTIEEIIPSNELHLDTQLIREHASQVFMEALKTLPKFERIALTLYMLPQHIPYKDIGYIMGYSESRAAQLVTIAKLRMKEIINGQAEGK